MDIQKTKPRRDCKKVYKRYKSYKDNLRNDFNNRCGYCDDLDMYCGGKRNYHIDHFKPHSIPEFEKLKHTYDNLVYSCPYCNGAKSNKWQNVNGFIDPCDPNYGKHIERHSTGQIISKSKVGDYIFINLSLGLFRHKLLWNIEKLDSQKKQLLNIIEIKKNEENNLIPIYEALTEIVKKLDSYIEIFYSEI